MEASNPGMTNAMKVRNFKLTLDHLAREGYDNADSKGDYEKLKGDFSRHFSTQENQLETFMRDGTPSPLIPIQMT